MSAAVLPDEGIADQLAYILSASIIGVLPWQLMLWVNDIEPDHATVLADLVEATWPGYAQYTLTRGGWITPTVTDGCCVSTWGTEPLVYTPTGASDETNYGMAYVDQSSGLLRWVQRFEDADIRPVEVGSSFKILPQYTLTSAECHSLMLAARRAAREHRRR